MARNEEDTDMEDTEEELESTGESDGSSDFDEDACSFSEQDSNLEEVQLTDEEIQGLIDQLLQVESQAAEAQEALEEESLATLRQEVKMELAEKLAESELDLAVEEEINTYIDQWKAKLDEIEDQSALLQERLEDAGVDLADLFKWIEKQTPEGCTTEAWKKRTHWAGLLASDEATHAVREAEKDLEYVRPVKRRHGKSIEEGASGFLQKKFSSVPTDGSKVAESSGEGWESLEALLGGGSDTQKSSGFGSVAWASVYLASTPEQAADLGLPGADQVEEIADLEKCKKDPFIAAALAHEKEIGLTEQQKENLRRVAEEDDIRKGRLIQKLIFKRKRVRKAKVASFRDVSFNFKQPSEAYMSGQVSGSTSIFESTIVSPLESNSHTTSTPSFKDSVQGSAYSEWNGESCKSDDYKAANTESGVDICKMADDYSKLLKEPDISEDGYKEASKIVINIDSDEDTAPQEMKLLSYRQETFAPEPDYDENKTKTCIGTQSLCATGSILSDKDDEGVGYKDKIIEPSRPLQVTYSALLGEMDKQVHKSLICTMCHKRLRLKEVRKHPLFEIAVCQECLEFYQSGPFSKDLDGSENECCLCANGGDVIMCDHCNKVICRSCISSNFGDDELKKILRGSEDYTCLCCDPEPLRPFIDLFRKASVLATKQYTEPTFSSDDEQFDVWERGREKRRKRLRRIIGDDELEESTRLKQALEKERKERLDRLRESAKATTSNNMAINTLKECPINIARDADEEEILIPLGIAQFLKPHQIEGVRFMWENCIESVRRVKSGDSGNGCILAHSMGLGKTLQVIAFLYTVLRRTDLGLRTALIVTPVNVLHNWPDEFEKWKPPEVRPLHVYVLDEAGRTGKEKLLSRWQKHGGVMMIGYSAFRTLSLGKHIKDSTLKEKICKALQKPGPDILVCDEAHMIKNKKADITQSLKQVNTQRRIALTGSPLQNNLMEYYCMVDFVREGFLGRPQDFKNRFQNPIENGQHADSTEYDVRCMKERTHVLHKQLTGFVQRKGASVVEQELPPKYIYVISVRLSALQRALYNKFIQLFWQPALISKSRKCLFTTYHALAKVWNHPDLLFHTKEEKGIQSEESTDEFICDDEDGLSSDDDTSNTRKEDKTGTQKSQKKKELENVNEMRSLDWCSDLINDKPQGMLEHGGKLVLLLDILCMSSERGEKTLVFSQSLPTLNLIESFLEKLPRHTDKNKFWRRDKEWYRLDGQTKAKDRQRLVKQFNDPNNSKVQCVLISTRAGSLGINLQAANRVVILDGSWNPTHDMQALFRAWRFGQKKPVVVYRLLAFGTAEEKIYKRQVAKEGLAARVLDEQQVGRHSKMEELKVLFKLDDDEHHTRGTDDADDDAPEDEIMTKLLVDHRPKWIVRIHQHETLLVDREDEKLTVEEQALAWENFRRIVECSNLDWVQVSGTGEHATTHLHNSWTATFQPTNLVSSCSAKSHAELLMSTKTKNNEHVKCDICQQAIGWEHIVKGKAARGVH